MQYFSIIVMVIQQKHIRISIACFLTGIILFNALAATICYPLALFKHYKDVRSKMPEKIVQFSLGVAAFKKAKVNAREICLNKQWFDLITVKVQGNRVFVTAIADTKEAAMHQAYQLMHHAKKGISLKAVGMFIGTVFNAFNFERMPLMRLTLFQPCQTNTISGFYGLIVPPPKVA